jgi:hypothetical protein
MKKVNLKKVLIVLTAMSMIFTMSSLMAYGQETSDFVADTTWSVALSSGWQEEAFTAVFLITETENNYAGGKWKITIKPPFPHPISGLDDSYVQTVLGIALMGMKSKAGMSWLLRAAMKDQMDAIMYLAVTYANNKQLKNKSEAERWFRKAMELGNTEAETKLNAMLARKSVDSSFELSNTYNFDYSLVKE